MVGVCLTVIGLLRVVIALRKADTAGRQPSCIRRYPVSHRLSLGLLGTAHPQPSPNVSGRTFRGCCLHRCLAPHGRDLRLHHFCDSRRFVIFCDTVQPQTPRMNAAQFRRLALRLPEAVENSHFDHPDFRVRNRIFATLGYPDPRRGMVKLTPGNRKNFSVLRRIHFVRPPAPGVGAEARSCCSPPSRWPRSLPSSGWPGKTSPPGSSRPAAPRSNPGGTGAVPSVFLWFVRDAAGAPRRRGCVTQVSGGGTAGDDNVKTTDLRSDRSRRSPDPSPDSLDRVDRGAPEDLRCHL